MKTKLLLVTVAAICIGLEGPTVPAQTFSSGSDGSMGALTVTSNTTLQLPPDGKFHFTRITINAGQTLVFNRNAMNTPVYLLATEDVAINGSINVSGAQEVLNLANPTGRGGPGGFDGGKLNGTGAGPGGGRAGAFSTADSGAGGGSYASINSQTSSTNQGSIYGSALLVPIVGGSGGGGCGIGTGGGGGGAIVVASNTRITVPGRIDADGENRFATDSVPRVGNAGSGGAIRLVAPVVSGGGTLRAQGGFGGGGGRIRVDTIDRTGLGFSPLAGTSYSIGGFMTVFPPGNPKLDIVQAAGTAIPEGTNGPVTITLPFGSDPNRTIVVQARNFNAQLPIDVVLTPDTGVRVTVQAQIDNAAANPATITVPVTFPVNTPVVVNAWTR